MEMKMKMELEMEMEEGGRAYFKTLSPVTLHQHIVPQDFSSSSASLSAHSAVKYATLRETGL